MSSNPVSSNPMSSNPWWKTLTPTELAELHQRVLHTLLAGFTSLSRADAEDLVQQAFVSLFRRRTAINAQDDGLYRYLLRAAKNDALDLKRTRRKRQAPHPNHQKSLTPTPHTSLSAKVREKKQQIREIFRELDEFDRLVLWSHAVDGCSILSIADELGISWYRVATSLDRSQRVIRRQLAE